MTIASYLVTWRVRARKEVSARSTDASKSTLHACIESQQIPTETKRLKTRKTKQPKKVVESNSDGPYAMRTVWGWTVNGPLGRSDHQAATANFIQSNELEKIFRQFCNREFNDVEDDVAMSCLDKRALKIMEESVRLKDDHYELALPWKNTQPSLPKNKSIAVCRLKCP